VAGTRGTDFYTHWNALAKQNEHNNDYHLLPVLIATNVFYVKNNKKYGLQISYVGMFGDRHVHPLDKLCAAIYWFWFKTSLDEYLSYNVQSSMLFNAELESLDDSPSSHASCCFCFCFFIHMASHVVYIMLSNSLIMHRSIDCRYLLSNTKNKTKIAAYYRVRNWFHLFLCTYVYMFHTNSSRTDIRQRHRFSTWPTVRLHVVLYFFSIITTFFRFSKIMFTPRRAYCYYDRLKKKKNK